jgi:hypothetical protein
VTGGDSGVTLDVVRPDDEAHEDALIAKTASEEAHVLVTNDRTFARRVRASRAACEVWPCGRLKAFIRVAAWAQWQREDA